MRHQEGRDLSGLLPNVIASTDYSVVAPVDRSAVNPAVIPWTVTEAFPVEARTSHCCKRPIAFHQAAPFSPAKATSSSANELAAE